jgi:uncharacterized surface protein with fasciclin (FAS1) repeats
MKRLLFAAATLLAAACQQEGGGNAVSTDANGTASSPRPAAKAEQPRTNMLEALEGSAEHKTLANAVKAAGLTETLSGAQPYTLFAPTEAAFQKLPGGTGALLAPEAKGRLVALLTGHVVPGVVTGEDLGRAIDRGKGKAELATVGGSNLGFSREGNSIVVTDAAGGRARVTRTDRLASNGVVHDVDGVLRSR